VATANPRYVVSGTAAGSTLEAARKQLPHGKLLQLGADAIYLVRTGATTLLLDARQGRIVQIGIVSTKLIVAPRVTLIVLKSIVTT
jgi:hypothetical protein